MVHECAEARLACALFLFRLFALGQIEHEADAFVGAFIEACRSDQDRHAPAVFADEFPLVGLDGPGPPQLSHTMRDMVAPLGWRQAIPMHATRDEIIAVVSG